MITTSLLNQIELGRSGKNQGFSMGLPKLESIIDGVTQSTYTLVFSPSGVGKTSIVLYSYIYRPLMEHLDDNKYKIIYYSLEMNAEMLMAKLLSMYIFENYNIELSTKELLSRRRGYLLSDENFKIVKECESWLKKIEEHLIIYDKGMNADMLYSSLIKELSNLGEFTEDGKRKVYIPNNPQIIVSVIIDHLSLCRPTNGRTLKQEMDLISSYLVTLRNRCKISPIVIMQANRDSSSMDRRKENMSNLTLNDAKDSGSPIQDSEIVLALFNPYREKLATYRGYDIRQLESRFRVITCLKNRYGESDIEVPCVFYGKVGIFKELPKADQIYDYAKYETPRWIIEDVEHEDNNEELTENNFNIVL